jgi:hypothetical protein
MFWLSLSLIGSIFSSEAKKPFHTKFSEEGYWKVSQLVSDFIEANRNLISDAIHKDSQKPSALAQRYCLDFKTFKKYSSRYTISLSRLASM